jgi:hypothetical protein
MSAVLASIFRNAYLSEEHLVKWVPGKATVLKDDFNCYF